MDAEKISSVFLRGLWNAVAKRKKSIRNQVANVEIKLEADLVEGENIENIIIDIEGIKNNESILVRIWSDRVVFLNVREKLVNGRYHNCRIDGRMIPEDFSGFVRRLEKTIDISFHKQADELNRLLRILWSDYICEGPNAVRAHK